VILDRLRYTRDVSLSPTLGELYRPQREEVERYDPAADAIELDLEIVQRQPARIRNNLVDMDVVIEDGERPFRVVGTDQRPSVLGSLRIPRGAVRFRATSLDIRDGTIDFDDPERVNPEFDVTAVTEVQRRQDVGAPNWRLSLRAHGNIDGFRLDATSTPELTQQDIMLLLTIGMTTNEAQQLEAQDIGTVGLEAISAISGVEGEVSGALGVIDDIELTTIYHPVTNRPEPQVTIGKRISDRIRVTASTGLSADTRAIQARAEWRVSGQTRLQAVYDNINRESSSSFGNIGLDLRWRLEFE
jgi:translocation and assembly module TamB